MNAWTVLLISLAIKAWLVLCQKLHGILKRGELSRKFHFSLNFANTAKCDLFDYSKFVYRFYSFGLRLGKDFTYYYYFFHPYYSKYKKKFVFKFLSVP